MVWRHQHCAPFTRLGIAAQVPSESGVYAVFEGESCLFVGEAWNLKGRLLEVVNVLDGHAELSIRWETCPENEMDSLRTAIQQSVSESTGVERRFPGIRVYEELLRRSA